MNTATHLNVLALDLSLTSTGYAHRHGHGTLKPRVRPEGRWVDLTGPARLSWIRDEILHLEHEHDVHLVAMEGYSFNSRASQAHSLGELGGVVRCALHDAGIRWIDIPPTSIKKYACGKGNADKLDVILAARDRLAYDGKSNDEADALWLHAMICDAVGHPTVTVPSSHRAALSSRGGTKAKPRPSILDRLAAMGLEVADAA